jgi:hypothetical protein
MGLVSKSIPNLINGVSQQPAALRLDTQGEVQINGYSDVVEGLKKRPPAKLINEMRDLKDDAPLENLDTAFFHSYKRNNDEEYTIVCTKKNGNIHLYVFDEEGECKYDTFDAGANVGYLGIDPSKLKAVTVSDSTFILNTEKTVGVSGGNTVTHDEKKSLVYLKSVNYGRTYRVNIMQGNTNKAYSTYTTQDQITSIEPNGSASDTQEINSSVLKTSTVIQSLRSIVSDGDVTTVYPSAHTDEPYFILRSTVPNYKIKVTDDDGGVNLKAFKNVAKSFTDLPNQCEDGFVLGVVGDNQKKEDDFYVRFEGTGGSGYWKECAVPNTNNGIDATDMPHMLKQNSDGSFSFSIAQDNFGESWAARYAGDNNTNPFPSFVGSKITDIFFHRNRLGLLSGENVIFSEAGGYLNFFRTTVRTLLDSDRIDVSVSQNEVSDLQHAIPIQDNLLLFSELNQFTLSASQLLTPSEVTIDQSTKYECDSLAKPVGAGTSVFFSTNKGGFSGVREFYTKSDTEIKEAPSITSHVPRYLEGRIKELRVSSNMDMLVALTTGSPKECYIYKWYNSDTERLQSSWSKWRFDKEILHVYFNNTEIKFVFLDGSIEKLDLSVNINLPLLDHQFTINADDINDGDASDFGGLLLGWLIGQAADNQFPVVTPSFYDNHTGWVALREDGTSLGEVDLSGYTYNGNVYHNLTADQADYYLTQGKSMTIGLPYMFEYQLSEQVFKPKQGDATQLARFQLRKMNLNYSNTGRFDVTVESVGRDAVLSQFTGRILGQQQNTLDDHVIVPEGTFQVGIQSQPKTTKITITNDSHLPCVFQSAEWEGFITLRNQRL